MPRGFDDLLQTLHHRFEQNPHRHPGLAWTDVHKRLLRHPAALRSLREMEATGGEPDVVGRFEPKQPLLFVDCAAESPSGRRSLCYDDDALDARKAHKPQGSALATAAAMGIDLLTEDQYRDLQQFGEFDTRTSSWLATPPDVRAAGGALFGDRRYGRVFVYHNGAPSYFAARGFRGALRI